MINSSRTASRSAGRRAFTLLEMMIVIGIILALGTLVLVNVIGTGEKADIKLVRADIKGFEAALEMFKSEMKRLPTEDEGLAVLTSRDGIENEDEQSKWGGPYIKELKRHDTWGSDWIYHQPSQLVDGEEFDIISPGPDRQEGTTDDISNHDGAPGAPGAEGDQPGGTGGGRGAGRAGSTGTRPGGSAGATGGR